MTAPLSRPFGLRAINGQPLPAEIRIGRLTTLVSSGRLQLLPLESPPDPLYPAAEGVLQWELYGVPKPDGSPAPVFLSSQHFRRLGAATLVIPATRNPPGCNLVGDFHLALTNDSAELTCVAPPVPEIGGTLFSPGSAFSFALDADARDLQPFTRFITDPRETLMFRLRSTLAWLANLITGKE